MNYLSVGWNDLLDYLRRVIDLGPEGGEKGGKVLAQGTPLQISQVANSYTGSYLKNSC